MTVFWNCWDRLRILLKTAGAQRAGRHGDKPASHPRALCIRVKTLRAPSRKRSAPAARGRRGLLAVIAQTWRRSAPGANAISYFGVWKLGTRRQAPRRNRTGDTCWRMMRPSRPGEICGRMGAV